MRSTCGICPSRRYTNTALLNPSHPTTPNTAPTPSPIHKTHPYKKDVYLTIYGYVTLQGATIKLDKQTVRVGKTFYVKTRTTELVGVVTGVKIVKE